MTVNVRDTVSSVGIIPRSLPHSTYNDGVIVFRHALALDECRARFRPNIWGEPIPVREELDDVPKIKERGDTTRDEWEYEPPKITDVKEVWFAGMRNPLLIYSTNSTSFSTGCHADVGGGSHGSDAENSLSNITLRWMIKECYLSKTGIDFDPDLLLELGLDLTTLENNPQDAKTHNYQPLPQAPAAATAQDTTAMEVVFQFAKDKVDAFADKYDQLSIAPFWWILEIIPMLSTHQTENGSWLRRRL